MPADGEVTGAVVFSSSLEDDCADGARRGIVGGVIAPLGRGNLLTVLVFCERGDEIRAISGTAFLICLSRYRELFPAGV
jgi:hypothetical protein